MRIAENTSKKPEKSKGESEIAALSGVIKIKSSIRLLEVEVNKLSTNIDEHRVQIKNLLLDKK